MPIITELASASDIWDRQDSAISLQNGKYRSTEERFYRYAKAAVTCGAFVKYPADSITIDLPY